jgi:CRISPR-associated protein Cse2 (CRISPR_cse2)
LVQEPKRDLNSEAEGDNMKKPKVNETALAVFAGVAAFIEEDASGTLGKEMAKANISKVIVDRLVKIELLTETDYNELMRQLREIVQMLGGRANVVDMADTICNWDVKKIDVKSDYEQGWIKQKI